MNEFVQNQLSQETAKVAANLQADSHLLFEIVLPSPDEHEVAGANVNPICGTLSQAFELALIHAQLVTILERVRYQTESVLPAVWDELESRWQTVHSIDIVEGICKLTIVDEISFALFFQIDDTRILGLVCHALPKNLAGEMLPRFHYEGTRLLAEIGSVSTEGPTTLLSAGERKCLIWCALGKTSYEIAKILDLSEHTVNHYFTIAASKLGANNRAHSVVRALKLGIISLDECG